MRWHLQVWCLLALRLVEAISTSGSRVLVVIEELGEQSKYSQFWADLEGEWHESTGKTIRRCV